MRKGWQNKSIALLKGNVYLLILSVGGGMSLIEGRRLILKYESKEWLAGPGGFINLLGFVLIALFIFEVSSRIIKYGLRRKRMNDTPEKKENDSSAINEAEGKKEGVKLKRNMILSFVFLLIYTALINQVGFVVASALYLIGNMLILKNTWKAILITTLLVTLFLLFGAPWLGISFPRGMFGF